MTFKEINIYCDESCHLEHEQERVMLVSCIHCPKDSVKQISNELRCLKEKYNISKRAELKWHKVSVNKKDYYYELISYFIENSDLAFRTIIIPHKEKLKHDIFSQTHSKWYYKMIYNLVKYIPEYLYSENCHYNVYIDKKENSYEARTELIKLKDCLRSHFHKDFCIQNIVSDQSELMQLNDFLQGAVSYINRGYCEKVDSNAIKKKVVELLKTKLNIELSKKNNNTKFNIFIWEAKDAD